MTTGALQGEEGKGALVNFISVTECESSKEKCVVVLEGTKKLTQTCKENPIITFT